MLMMNVNEVQHSIYYICTVFSSNNDQQNDHILFYLLYAASRLFRIRVFIYSISLGACAVLLLKKNEYTFFRPLLGHVLEITVIEVLLKLDCSVPQQHCITHINYWFCHRDLGFPYLLLKSIAHFWRHKWVLSEAITKQKDCTPDCRDS